MFYSLHNSYTNHERSKKHHENVAMVKQLMEEEEKGEDCSASDLTGEVGTLLARSESNSDSEDEPDSAATGMEGLSLVEEVRGSMEAGANSSDGEDLALSSIIRCAIVFL